MGIYNLKLLSTSTNESLEDLFLKFARAHPYQQVVIGKFFITDSNTRPQGLPGTGYGWLYSYGFFIVRTYDASTHKADGIIILFAWNDTSVALKSCGNNIFSAWRII